VGGACTFFSHAAHFVFLSGAWGGGGGGSYELILSTKIPFIDIMTGFEKCGNEKLRVRRILIF
jgi:hypothetical protein